ncbi:hypothetical protein CVT26_003844 [Gymnopilus dilepis]|uniref:Uncharacterized protein n=1 Tax=Gymnopilus dilepis TaxID=231916 RepID=A0A409YUV6_9AGAR|nr:hypothetical protein CVT26_003844 [Gymnopilus dilepis]
MKRVMDSLSDVKGFPDLPLEIIIEIFRRCLPDFPDPFAFKTNHAPLLLTHVCSSWRKVACQIPELWQSISLAAERHGILNEPRMLSDQFDLWNANARQYPLDLILTTTDNPIPWDDLIVRIFIGFSERFRNLSLEISSHRLENFCALPSANFSILESLQFHTFPTRANLASGAREVVAFKNAPKLRRVALLVSRLRIDLPWAQLTHLQFDAEKPYAFYHFISRNCPLLQYLSLSLSDDAGTTVSSLSYTDVVVMHHLKNLSLTLPYESEHHLSPFAWTDFPALDPLRLCNSDWSAPSILMKWALPFSKLQKRVISQLGGLRSLSLGYQKIRYDAMIEILRQTPLLVELELDSELEDYTLFFKALTYDAEKALATLPAPRLQDLRLFVETNHLIEPHLCFNVEFFRDMITSRSDGYLAHLKIELPTVDQPANLTHVALCIEHPLDDDLSRHFAEINTQIRRDLSSVEDLKVDFTFDCASDKTNWVKCKFPMW